MGSPCQTSYEARLFLRAQRGESIVIPNEPRLAQGQIELSDLAGLAGQLILEDRT